MTINAGAVSAAPLSDEATTADRRPLPARMMLLVVAIVAGAIGNLINTAIGSDGDTLTVSWLAKHQSAWAVTTYGNALTGLGLLAVLVSVCVLVRRRGATWATVSLAVGTIATLLYVVSAAIPIGALPMGTQNVVSSTDASALLDYFGKHDFTQPGVAFPGFLLLLITQITVTVALIRSRAVPLWVPIVFIVGAVVETVFASEGALTAVLTVPQIVAEIAIGWYAYRKSTA
jgi:hypothetical protein